MKLTFCTYDYSNYVGGPNAWLRRLLPDLRRRGVQSRVLSVNLSRDEECPTVLALRQDGFDCTTTPRPQYTEDLVRWILGKLSDDPPDVFVPNFVLPAYYATRWLREANISTVGIMHSYDNLYRAISDRFVFGDVAYRLSGLICVSKFVERLVSDRDPKGILVRHIAPSVSLPETLAPIPNGKLRLAYAGRLVEEAKRITEVTRAMCRAVREVPQTEAFIYGDGKARDAVERILNEQGKHLPIHLVGRVDSTEIQRYLLECHAVVLLSDYEGLPIAFMDAMACGVVPIGLRAPGGIPELVEDGVTGLLVNDRGDEFVSAVRRLRYDTALWQRLSRAARARIEREYTIDAGADQWCRLLDELRPHAGQKRSIRIPYQLTLPPVHPSITWGDKRAPRPRSRIIRPVERFVRHIKSQYPLVFGPQ